MHSKRFFLILILLFFINIIRAQEDELEWEWKNTIVSDYHPPIMDFYHTAFDSEGNWYHFGVCKEFISINGEEISTGYERNVYVKKYNSSGQCIDYFIFNYIKAPFSNIYITPQDILLDSEDNIILSFSYAGIVLYRSDTIADIFLNEYVYDKSAIVKLDKYGNYLYTIDFEKSYFIECYSIDIDAENNIYATGFYKDTLIVQDDTVVSAYGRDAFLLKIGANGEKQWLKSFGGSCPGDEGYSVAVGQDGNCYLLVYFQCSYTIEDIFIGEGKNIIKYSPSGDYINSFNLWDILFPEKGYNGLDKCLSFNNSNNLLVHRPYHPDYLIKMSYDLENVYLDLSDTSKRNFLKYIHMDLSDNIIISGSFRDTLQIGDTAIYKPGINYYILAYNELEKLSWIKYTDRYYLPNSYNNSVYLTNAVDSIWVFGKIKQSANNIKTLPKKNIVKIFPNPTTDLLHIELQDFTESIERIVIYDIIGSQKLIVKENINRNKLNLSLSKLNIGIYTIEIITNRNKYYKKIIKA